MDLDRYRQLLSEIDKTKSKEHKGKWLDKAAVDEYIARLKKIDSDDIQDIGKRRQLRIELQEEYGLSEVEAINILNGHNTRFYIDKYQRMKVGKWNIKKDDKKKPPKIVHSETQIREYVMRIEKIVNNSRVEDKPVEQENVEHDFEETRYPSMFQDFIDKLMIMDDLEE